MSIKKQRVLTGDRPTGSLHLGHYVGSLINRVRMQDDYDCFIMIADVQALTDNFTTPEKVRDNVLEVAIDNLSLGVDAKKVTYFIQSQIPEIAELTVFFSNLVTVSELQRNPTVKNEIQEKGNIFKDGVVNLGFLSYPVSQAADITFCRADIVPVGKDQEPMIEQTRRIVNKFNTLYGEVFQLPQGLYTEISKLNGLDGRKMSKSLNNAIYLSDDEDTINKKISQAKTDTKNSIIFNQEESPDISNLIMYYHIVSKLPIKDIEEKYKNITSYKLFKEDLAKEINTFLKPIREKRKYYKENIHLVWEMLEEGRARAKLEAEKTMLEVKKAMKILYNNNL